MVPSTDAVDDGGTSDIGTVTAEYIAPDLRALTFAIADLRLAPDNARAHADADIDAVAESLRLHGQQKPVVAKRTYRGIANAVLAGNGTLQAARRLGWTRLAVVWFSGNDHEAREYAYRDNLTQEKSRWDADQLRADADTGLDLLSLGFDGAMLADLLGADAPVPKFAPVETEYRLDELQPHCRTCTCRQGAKS
jgi:ParB-like chromosome segregation protein Spo0J